MDKLKSRLCTSVLALAGALASSGGAWAEDSAQPFDQLVVFGDQLSDGGAFAAAAPAGAGSFTTNPDPVWAEVVASDLGLPLTPNIGQNGLNYATGGARVDITRTNGRASVDDQIGRFGDQGRAFTDRSLVLLQGGATDFDLEGNNSDLDEAARDLAGFAGDLVDDGAGTVVLLNLPGVARFNRVLNTELADSGVNLIYFDANALLNEVIAAPGQFGISNVTGSACTVTARDCLPANYVTPTANATYLFADAEPVRNLTGAGQRILGDAVVATLLAPGQISQLRYAAEATFRGHRSVYQARLWRGNEAPGTGQVFGAVGFGNFTSEGGRQLVGLDEDTTWFSLGYERQQDRTSAWGVQLAGSQGDGEFEAGRGEYDTTAYSLAGYLRYRAGDSRASVDAVIGQIDYDITRRVRLGPAARAHAGSTDGSFYALRAEGGVDLALEGWYLGPVVGLSFEKVEIEGYSEGGALSTQLTYGDQDLDAFYGEIGFELRGENGRISPHLRVTYEHDFRESDQDFTITPAGAPVSFTTAAFQARGGFIGFNAGVEGRLTDHWAISAIAAGYTGRDDLDALSGAAALTFTW